MHPLSPQITPVSEAFALAEHDPAYEADRRHFSQHVSRSRSRQRSRSRHHADGHGYGQSQQQDLEKGKEGPPSSSEGVLSPSPPPLQEGVVDPFGEQDGEVKYMTMEWWQAAMVMIAENISLGILSLPAVLAALGFVPGLILLVGIGLLTTYTAFMIGQFKLAHPEVFNMADAGMVLFGRWGREIFGAAQFIFMIFCMGSHLLTFTIAFNTITSHATCTIAWGVVALVAFWILTLPRTLKNVSYMSFLSAASIFTAVMITMIGVGVSPAESIQLYVTKQSTLAPAFLSVANILFAYAGHVAFFSFISEMKKPHEFPKTIATLQIADISLYILVATVIYRYTGDSVASPALGSTGPTLRKVAYGIALPTIVIAGVIFGHVSSKYIYLRLFGHTGLPAKRTPWAIGSWALIALVLWAVAWVIAESIPSFSDLLALISSIFASWFSIGIPAIFWLHLNWGRIRSSWRKCFLAAVNWLIILLAAGFMGLGLYSSGKAIHDDASSASWSCADNST